MNQLIWKAIKSSFGMYSFKLSDFKGETLEEIKDKHDLVTRVQIKTFIIFIVIVFGITGLIIINN